MGQSMITFIPTLSLHTHKSFHACMRTHAHIHTHIHPNVLISPHTNKNAHISTSRILPHLHVYDIHDTQYKKHTHSHSNRLTNMKITLTFTTVTCEHLHI